MIEHVWTSSVHGGTCGFLTGSMWVMSSSPTSLKSAHSLRNLAHRWGIPPRFQMRLIGAPAAAAGNFDAIKNWPPTSQSVNQLLTCAGYATPPPPPPLIPVTKKCTRTQLDFVKFEVHAHAAPAGLSRAPACELWQNSPAHLPSFGESSLPFPNTQILKPVSSL